MASPEYSTLKKTLTRFRLSGLSASAGGIESGISNEIERLKYIIDQNEIEIGAEGCRELTKEFTSPVKEEVISRPLRRVYRVAEELQDGELSDDLWEEIRTSWESGHNILVKGGVDGRKCDTIRAACKRYLQAHPEYSKLYLLVRKCSKRTSEMELCFERRRYTDNRIQLGYIAEGEILAKENPDALVVLVLDEVDTMDIFHGLEVFLNLLEKKGNDQLVCRNCLLNNNKNFMLFATENTENENRNVNMDNPVIGRLFDAVSIWNPLMEKQARHRMV